MAHSTEQSKTKTKTNAHARNVQSGVDTQGMFKVRAMFADDCKGKLLHTAHASVHQLPLEDTRMSAIYKERQKQQGSK